MAKHRKRNTLNYVLAFAVGSLIGVTTYKLNQPETTSQTIQSTEVQSSSQTVQTSETTSQDSESSISTDSVTEESSTEIAPSAQIPEWYDQASDLISDFQSRADLAKSQNTTFPVGSVVDEVRSAIDLMSQYETDHETLALYVRQILTAKGYEMTFAGSIMEQAFSNY